MKSPTTANGLSSDDDGKLKFTTLDVDGLKAIWFFAVNTMITECCPGGRLNSGPMAMPLITRTGRPILVPLSLS